MNVELPDLDGMMGLVDEIYKLNVEKGKLELAIKLNEADITKRATTEEKYFVNGKPPSQAYIDNSYKVTGFDGELPALRLKLIDVESLLYKLRGEFELEKIIIDIWRTQAANERTSFG